MRITQDMILTASEVMKLFKVLEEARDLALYHQTHYVHVRDHYIIKTLLESGLRVFELTELRVKDFRRNVLIIQCGKFGKKRETVLTDTAQRLIKDWIKVKRNLFNEPTSDENYLFTSQWGKSYTTTGIRKRVKYWFAKCGFNPDFSCHTCRHSYVSHGLASGVDLIRMRDNVGHSSLNTTTIYSHAINNDLGDVEIYKRKSFASSPKRNL
jgi:integrase/recombinase XerD